MYRSGNIVRSFILSSRQSVGILRSLKSGATTTYIADSRALLSSSTLDTIFPNHEDFATRHIGPNHQEIRSMLDLCGVAVSILS